MWDREAAAWHEFPRIFLGGTVADEAKLLPAVLESLPLALLTVSGGGTSEANAYETLIGLADGTVLRDLLVDDGSRSSIHAGGPPPNSLLKTAVSERATTARQILDQLRKLYLDLDASTITLKDTLETDGVWELRKPMLTALEKLLSIASGAEEIVARGGAEPPAFPGLPVPR